jgi:hypothetical protein
MIFYTELEMKSHIRGFEGTFLVRFPHCVTKWIGKLLRD